MLLLIGQGSDKYLGEGVTKLFIRSILVFFLLLTSAFANTDKSWEIKRISGTAWLLNTGSGKQLILEKGTFLQAGQTLKTGDRTRILLARGKERIQVGSNTVLSIPKTDQSKPNHTTIKLDIGKLDLIVKKMPSKHFTVQTPFIAAVVKGTRFSVSTSSERAMVRVFEGLVGVTSLISSDIADIRPGKSASITRSATQKARLLLLDSPAQERSFETFPEVFGELNIPNPNDWKPTTGNKDGDISASGVIATIFSAILTAVGAAFYSIGNALSAIFTPIIMPAIELIDHVFETILPNSTPILLGLAAIIGFGIVALLAMSIRKHRG